MWRYLLTRQDKILSFNLIYCTEINIFEWNQDIVAMVIGSDGVWEKIPNKIIAKMVEKEFNDNKDARKLVNDIVNRAIVKWKVVIIQTIINLYL